MNPDQRINFALATLQIFAAILEGGKGWTNAQGELETPFDPQTFEAIGQAAEVAALHVREVLVKDPNATITVPQINFKP